MHTHMSIGAIHDEHAKKDGYFFTSDGSLVLSSLLQILTIIFHPV